MTTATYEHHGRGATMNTTPATTKQLDYLLALINQAEGTSVRFISQTKFSKANLNMRRSGSRSRSQSGSWSGSWSRSWSWPPTTTTTTTTGEST